MSLNNLFVKSKFENHIEMENVESPSKSSPMNLSTRPIERNVLKELNNLEGATKSSKQVSSATDDQEIQLKDSTNLSNNLPDIVTNVHSDGGKVVNKNLLYVVTPPDVLSDDEYVDCNTTLKDNLLGLTPNKTFESVPNLLDKTIEILGKIGPTPNEPNQILKSETSKIFIQNQSMNDDTESVALTGNFIDTAGQCIGEQLFYEKETIIHPTVTPNVLNESVNVASTEEIPLAIENVQQKTSSIPGKPLPLSHPVIDSQVPVIESSAIFIDSAAPESQNDLQHHTTPLTRQLNSDFTGNLTKFQVESTNTALPNTDDSSTCVQDSTLSLPNNEINRTVVVETNLGYESETDTYASEPVELQNSSGVKEFRECKVNQTISVDSLDIDGETRDGLLDSLEMNEPKQHEQTTPIDKFLSATLGDEMFASEKSSDLSEMFSNSNQTPNQKTYEENSGRFSLSRQNAVYYSPTVIHNQSDVPTVNEKILLPNDETLNNVAMGQNDKSRTVLEESSEGDLPVANESISTLQGTFSVSSTVVSRQDEAKKTSETAELPSENSSNECSTSDKIDSTNRLKRRCTYNVSSIEDILSNADIPTPNDSNESRSSLPRQATFSISMASNDNPIRQLTFDVSNVVDTNDTPKPLSDVNFRANKDMNEPNLNLLSRQTNFSVNSPEVSQQIMSQRSFDIPIGSNDKTITVLEELPNIDVAASNESTDNFQRQDTFTVPSPIVSNQSGSQLSSNITELSIEKSSNKCLGRSRTYDVSSPVGANDKSINLLGELTNFESEQSDFQFKAPPLPISTVKTSTKADSDDSFMVLSSNDFDFLQSRGGNCDPEDDRRSSLLLRFDPLSRRSVHKPQFAPTAEIVETKVGCEKNLQEIDSINLCGNSSGENSCDEQQSLKTQSQAINADEMSVSLVHDSNNMDNETNSYVNHIKTDDKHIAVGGVPLSDKKIKFEYSDGNIQKKMEEYEATQEILVKRLTEKDKTLSKNCAIIEAYEKALAELVAEKEKLTDNYEVINEKLRHERDIHHQHLMSLETTFSDLHMKYERSKEFTVQLQERLDLLSEEKAKIDELLKQQELRYEKMKQHALHQLEYANSTLEDQEKNNTRENSRLKALLKIEEVSRNTIQEQLLQKCKENDELVKICDELIGGQKS